MPAQLETTHTLIPNKLVIYRRERSTIWQCRMKIGDRWVRSTTKERDLKAAQTRAHEMLIEAQIRLRSNLPVVTKRFRDIAKLAIERMEQETKNGTGKSSYGEYVEIINRYLIPALGKRNISNIDKQALDELDKYRVERMGKTPKRSTLLSHNAALQKVFDEAVSRGLLASIDRPELELKGENSERHAAFSAPEVAHMQAALEQWEKGGRNEKERNGRELLRDYVTLLLDTGARPGKELLNLKWSQLRVEFEQHPSEKEITQDEEYNDVEIPVLARHLVMTVSGKTGKREILGSNDSIQALRRIAKRNYQGKTGPAHYPVLNLVNDPNSGYVVRLPEQKAPTSFAKLFDRFLKQHDLLFCPTTGRRRVFYSLRHTYATLALIHDNIGIHTLAKQMGTSVQMIEKHYSHLDVFRARYQLQTTNTKKEIAKYKRSYSDTIEDE